VKRGYANRDRVGAAGYLRVDGLWPDSHQRSRSYLVAAEVLVAGLSGETALGYGRQFEQRAT